jgi:hypothetical protein
MKALNRSSLIGMGIALLAALPATGRAQTQGEQPQVYQVELLIFRHTDQTRTTGEIPRAPEPEILDVLEQDLPKMGDGSLNSAQMSPAELAARGLSQEQAPPGWIVLNNESLLLNNIANRLENLSAYDLVEHLGWVQIAPDVAAAEQIDLADLGLPDYLATGQVNLFQRRYLHLAINIALANTDARTTGSDNGLFADTLKPFRGPVALPAINESRRIRLEELVYFDQPQFGVLAMVARSNRVLPEIQ